MDEKGGIYSLDFKFITNMEDNKIEIEEDWNCEIPWNVGPVIIILWL